MITTNEMIEWLDDYIDDNNESFDDAYLENIMAIAIRDFIAAHSWQDISIAPRYGKLILGAFHDGKFYQQMAGLYNKNGKSTVVVGFRKNEWPTHWMHLPAAPQPKED